MAVLEHTELVVGDKSGRSVSQALVGPITDLWNAVKSLLVATERLNDLKAELKAQNDTIIRQQQQIADLAAAMKVLTVMVTDAEKRLPDAIELHVRRHTDKLIK